MDQMSLKHNSVNVSNKHLFWLLTKKNAAQKEEEEEKRVRSENRTFSLGFTICTAIISLTCSPVHKSYLPTTANKTKNNLQLLWSALKQTSKQIKVAKEKKNNNCQYISKVSAIVEMKPSNSSAVIYGNLLPTLQFCSREWYHQRIKLLPVCSWLSRKLSKKCSEQFNKLIHAL